MLKEIKKTIYIRTLFLMLKLKKKKLKETSKLVKTTLEIKLYLIFMKKRRLVG